MILSYAITICNELEEIKRLLPFLLEKKGVQDEIVILFDEKNGSPEVLEYLLTFNKLPNVQTWRGFDFENNFAEQEFLPDEIQNTSFYEPGNNVREKELRNFLKNRWKDKYGY